MKPVNFSHKFEKAYSKRIIRDRKLKEAFETKYQLFCGGERDYPLNDHALGGEMKGKRSFSITADVRVVYEETESSIIFLDIGTHAQVY